MRVPKRAFLDANVFVTNWTADVMLTLAEHGIFEPRWSNVVIAEATRALVRMGSEEPWVEGYLGAANRTFPFARVDVDEAELTSIELPDPDDRHVAVAAISSGCDAIVTYNLKDFPASALAGTGLAAMHPDDFLLSLGESRPSEVVRAVRELVASKRHPPRSMGVEIAGLRKNRLPGFAGFLSAYEVAAEPMQ